LGSHEPAHFAESVPDNISSPGGFFVVFAVSHYIGPVLSVVAVLIGIAFGWVIRSSVETAQVAGTVWLVGLGLLIVGAARNRTSQNGSQSLHSLALAALLVYAVALFVAQPSMRTDGNTEAAVIATAVWLIPAAVGGVVLPRSGRCVAPAGCWCLLVALSTAAAGSVSHRSSAIGLFGVVWD
jgi:uncharacterized membrane protein HdeD (DUF308 family)